MCEILGWVLFRSLVDVWIITEIYVFFLNALKEVLNMVNIYTTCLNRLSILAQEEEAVPV